MKKTEEKDGGPKAAVMKNKHARLVESGAKDKKNIAEELKRSWGLRQIPHMEEMNSRK